MARHQRRTSTRADNRRSYSQNFLYDRGSIDRVVTAAGLRPGDLVVEPGAGPGTLTRALARRARKVIAYEIDARYASRLSERTRADPRIVCVHRDFRTAGPPAEPFTLVGNIPYSVTAPIVDWCLRARGLSSATMVTQLEYARKRTGDYGRWSLLTVRTWAEFGWRLCGRIDRQLFRPVPRVDSGILRITRRPAPLVADPAAYRRLVELGFTGVGGSLDATLRRHYPARRVLRAFRAAGIAPGTVVAYVTPAQWIALYENLLGKLWRASIPLTYG